MAPVTVVFRECFVFFLAVCSSILYLASSHSGKAVERTCPCEVCPCYCPCVDRSALRVGFVRDNDDRVRTDGAWTRPSFALASGVRQAARDRGLGLSYFSLSDTGDLLRFFHDLLQDGSLDAVVVTGESIHKYMEPLVAAAQKGIPVYIVGNVPQSLLLQLRARIVATYPEGRAPALAGCIHIGSVTEAVAAAAAERLISAGMQRVHCINTHEEHEGDQEMCRAVVEAFTSRDLKGEVHTTTSLFVPMTLTLDGIAKQGPWASGNGTALVVIDTAAYSQLNAARDVRGLLPQAHVLVLETSMEVLADVRSGKAVTAQEQPYFSQGYLALALAVQELVTGQMLTKDVSSPARFISGGEVTDADIERELCREEGFPVCGDPGVANTSATGCACFHRSSVNFHVLATLPTVVELRREVIAGLLDAQRDMPGTAYTWVMGQDTNFNGRFAQTVASAALTQDNWTSLLSLDSDLAPVDSSLRSTMIRLGQIKGNRTYWLGGYRDEALPVDAFLAPFLADGYMGPSPCAWATLGRTARDRLRGTPGLSVLVYAPVPYLPLWAQAVHNFVDGFFDDSLVYSDDFWRPPVQGDAVAGTGVWSLFCDGWKEPGVTNGSDLAPELVDQCSLLSAARLQIKLSPPAVTPRPPFVQGLMKALDRNDSSMNAGSYDAVVVAPLLADDVPLTLQALEDITAMGYGGAMTKLFSMVCLSKDVQAFAYPDSLPGGQRHTGCLDLQLQLGTYITYVAAALHQQTLGERLLSLDVSTERVVTRDNFARGQQQRLADCRIARTLGQEVETMFPVCDVHAGCGGNDTAPPCSGHGLCQFPTAQMNAAAGGHLPPWLGRCACDRGFKGVLCADKDDVAPSWLKVWLPVAVGCFFFLLLLSLLLCKQLRGLWVERAKQQLMWTRKRRRPAEGQHLAVVFTDIEGSTALWEWNPEVMVQALQIHFKVLRALLPKHNGYESNTEGDAFELVFHNASDALHWTMDAQLALLHPEKTLGHGKLLPHWSYSSTSSAWPLELLTHPLGAEVRGKNGSLLHRGLRVRMGIHVGVPEGSYQHPNGRQRYLGKVVTLAKAIGDAPDQGGQVLLSLDAWASQDMASELMPLVAFSMGDHVLSKELPPLGLMMVLPQALQGRVPFRPLRSHEQLSPSFFDAPASDCFLTDLPPTSPVAIMFTFVCAGSALKRNSAYPDAVRLLTEFVRATLHAHKGYECEEKDGNFLLAFGDPLNAATFSQEMQIGAMGLPWPDALMMEEAVAEVVSPRMSRQMSLPNSVNLIGATTAENMRLVFRGLRIKTGICWGYPVRCLPHGSTGRAAYFGPLMNRAARMASSAAEGQTLCNAQLVEAVQRMQDAEGVDVGFMSLGEFPLKGVAAPVELIQVSNSRLINRRFPPRMPAARRLSATASMGLSRQLSIETVLWSPTMTRQVLSRQSLESNLPNIGDLNETSPVGTEVLTHVLEPAGDNGRAFFGPANGSSKCAPKYKLMSAPNPDTLSGKWAAQEGQQGSPVLWRNQLWRGLDSIIHVLDRPLKKLAGKGNKAASEAPGWKGSSNVPWPGRIPEETSMGAWVCPDALMARLKRHSQDDDAASRSGTESDSADSSTPMSP
eukprot:jgi/Mesvir1/27008/Mv20715-RA.1